MVTDWNNEFLLITQQTSGNLVAGPPEVAREIAQVGAAMSDAVNAATGSGIASFAYTGGPMANANANIAAATAAYTALTNIFTDPVWSSSIASITGSGTNTSNTALATNIVLPELQSFLSTALSNAGLASPGACSTSTSALCNGYMLGIAAANAVDNSTTFSPTASGAIASIKNGLTPQAPAGSGTTPGVYVPPSATGGRPEMFPTWGSHGCPDRVTSGQMAAAEAAIPAPPAITSAAYANALLQTECQGSSVGLSALPSNIVTACAAAGYTQETTEQAKAALFWNDPGTTIQPPGHWLQIANTAMTSQNSSLLQSAELTALLGEGMNNAGIAAWNAKYANNLWRPVTAIRDCANWSAGTFNNLRSHLVLVDRHAAALAFDRTDNYGGNFSTLISGSGGVTVDAGNLTLTNANTFTGQVTIAGGTVSVSSIGNAGSNGNLGADSTNGTTATTAPIVITANTTASTAGTLNYTGSGESTNRNIFFNTAISEMETIAANGTGTLNLTGTLTTQSNNATAGQSQLILTGAGAGELSGNYISAGNKNYPGISMQGTGTWTLASNLSYQGMTDVESGVLQFNSITNTGGAASALGTASNLFQPWLANIGKFGKAGFSAVPYAITLGVGSTSASTSTGTLQYNGSGPASSNRNIGLNGNGDISNIAVSGGNALTLSGSITPIASVSGGLTLFLDGTNTDANTVSGVINDLAVATGTTNAGFASGTSTITLSSTAGLVVGETITGTNLSAVITAIGSSGTVTLSSATSGTVTSGEVLTTTPTTLGLTKQGAGTWVLSNANTYGGATAVNGGTLQIGNGGTSGSLGSTSGVSVSSGATLAFDRTDNYGGNFSTVITDGAVPGGAVTVSAGTLTTIAANSYTGATTIGSGATLQLGAGGTVGALSASSNITDNGTFVIDRSDAVSQGTVGGSATIFGNAITGSGGLTQLGSGTTTLTAANTYQGGTLISAGTLALNGAGASLYSAGAVVDNATFDISQSANQTIGTLNGSGVVNLGAYQLTTNSGATGTQTFSGNIMDGGLGSGTGGALAVDGGQLLVLSGSNSFTGTTTIGATTASVVQYSGANAIGSTVNTIVGNGSTVQLAGIGTSGSSTQTLTLEGGSGGQDGAAGGSLESVSGNNTLADTVNLTATTDVFADSGSTLNLSGPISSTAMGGTQTLFLKGASTGTSTISGVISNGSTGGKIALNENTFGTWVLSNTNSYTGATTVSAGNLQVTGSLASGSAVTVGNNTGGRDPERYRHD